MCCIAMIQLYVYICMRKHNQQKMTDEHISLEKYTSHTLFLKGLRKVGYVWEVSWRRRETATYWTQVPLTIAALLPHSAGLLNGVSWGPKPSVWSWFSLRHLISDSNCNRNWTDCLPASNSNWRCNSNPN